MLFALKTNCSACQGTMPIGGLGVPTTKQAKAPSQAFRWSFVQDHCNINSTVSFSEVCKLPQVLFPVAGKHG